MKNIIENEYKKLLKLMKTNDYAKQIGSNKILIQEKYEIINLIEYVIKRCDRSNTMRFVEIGSRLGGSFALFGKCFSQFFPKVNGMSIDLPNLPHENTQGLSLKKMIEQLECNFRHKVLLGDSHSKETPKNIKTFFKNNPIDMIFIDGDHSEEGSMQDFVDYAKFVRPDGIMAFHDIIEPKHWPWVQVHKTWEKIKNIHPNNTIAEWSYNHLQYGIGAIVL